jgi:hypothetical protein
MAALYLGIAFIATSVLTELIMGSPRRVFDWHWPKKRYPTGGDSIKLRGARLMGLAGTALLLGWVIAQLL